MKQKNNSKVTAIVAVSFSVLLIAAVVSGLVSGYLRLGKQPTSAAPSICSAYIEDYNKILNHYPVEERDSMYKKVADSAAGVSGSDSDPTCVYMRYTYAANKGDSKEVVRLGSVILDLAKEGAYMSSSLDNVVSPALVKKAIDVNSGAGSDEPDVEMNGSRGNG